MAEETKKIKKKRTLLQRIVNVFLYIGISLIILLVLAFGFSQTSTFRDYLRDKVVEAANSELNGKISIEKIDGTIFTSLVLRNTIVNMGTDTLLNAGSIELRTSPLKILLKTIYVRYFEIKDAKIHLVKDKDGGLNIARLFPPPSGDTTKSEFPFKLQAAVFKLSSVDFSLQNYNKVGSREVYDKFNPDDIRIKNLNLKLNAYAFIKGNDFELSISNLSFDSDIRGVNLNKLTGNFQLQGDKIRINNLRILTRQTDMMLNAGADNLNLFDGSVSFKKTVLNINLDAPIFHFRDLSAFVPGTEILNGNIALNLKASGTFEKLIVKNLEAALPNTHVQAQMSVSDIDDPNDMSFNARFKDSYINQNDISNLLPSLGIPVYQDYGTIKIDTLEYTGKPLDFRINLLAKTELGTVGFKGSINLLKTDMAYDLNAYTKAFNIKPLAGINSSINSKLILKGKGISPEKLLTNVSIIADGSTISGNKIDTLRLTADAQKKKINYNLKVRSKTSFAKLNGYFDFTVKSDPSYDLEGNLNNINLADLTKDTTLQTDLNFNVSALGDKFDLNLLNLFLSMKMYQSTINGIVIDSTRAIVDLRHDDKGKRVVNIISDLADITMIGKFTIPQTVSFLSGEIGYLSSAVKEKLNKIFPASPDAVKDLTAKINQLDLNKNELPETDSLMDVKYAIEFKDFSLLSLFLGDNQLELDGDVTGELKNNTDTVFINLKTNLKYLKFWGSDNVFFLSNLDLNLDLSNDSRSASFKELNSNMKLSANRIFLGNDIYNLILDVRLDHDTAGILFSAKLEDYASAKINSIIDLSDSTARLSIDTLRVNYNNFVMSNKGKIKIDYGNNNLKINKFVLSRNGAELEVGGKISKLSDQDFEITVSNLSLNDLLVNMLGYKSNEVPDSKISLNIVGLGTLENPQFKCLLDAESIRYKNKKFGKLIGQLKYMEKDLSLDIQFLDSLINRNNPVLFINGKIPINLSLKSGGKRLIDTEPVNIILSILN